MVPLCEGVRLRLVADAARSIAAHINNLYNTTFWALVLQGGQSTTQANETLSVSSCANFIKVDPAKTERLCHQRRVPYRATRMRSCSLNSV